MCLGAVCWAKKRRTKSSLATFAQSRRSTSSYCRNIRRSSKLNLQLVSRLLLITKLTMFFKLLPQLVYLTRIRIVMASQCRVVAAVEVEVEGVDRMSTRGPTKVKVTAYTQPVSILTTLCMPVGEQG